MEVPPECTLEDREHRISLNEPFDLNILNELLNQIFPPLFTVSNLHW